MNPHSDVGNTIRLAKRATLAQALLDSRADTLATFARYETALAPTQCVVPQSPQWNPPLWELGHIGWFQEVWLARFSQVHLGAAANPSAKRGAPLRPDADALYDSSLVAQGSRWQLPLPDAKTTRTELAAQLAQTLALLQATPDDDTALYFMRLVLLHEDMHHEAALYTAQALGIDVDDARWVPQQLHSRRQPIAQGAGPWRLGREGPGFAFDNELGAHNVTLGATAIDSRVLSWAEYLPFVLAGGYAQPQWWSEPGRVWLAEVDQKHGGQSSQQRLQQRSQLRLQHQPRYLRYEQGTWQRQQGSHWLTLDMSLPACHLTLHEAQAWCAWAGRRLPLEAEWERAAFTQPDLFEWGAVWEWTASTFAPYPGFAPHPYRDYSAPWFGTHQVLRGASVMTQARMHNARYRNYFTPERNDICAGFRSCAL